MLSREGGAFRCRLCTMNFSSTGRLDRPRPDRMRRRGSRTSRCSTSRFGDGFCRFSGRRRDETEDFVRLLPGDELCVRSAPVEKWLHRPASSRPFGGFARKAAPVASSRLLHRVLVLVGASVFLGSPRGGPVAVRSERLHSAVARSRRSRPDVHRVYVGFAWRCRSGFCRHANASAQSRDQADQPPTTGLELVRGALWRLSTHARLRPLHARWGPTSCAQSAGIAGAEHDQQRLPAELLHERSAETALVRARLRPHPACKPAAELLRSRQSRRQGVPASGYACPAARQRASFGTALV